MTPAPISVERLRELLDSLGTVSDGDYLSRLANGQRINDACINWLRDNGAALLHQLAENEKEADRLHALINAGNRRIAELEAAYMHYRPLAERAEAAERAREEATWLLRKAWRILDIDAPNDKTTDDIAAYLAASGGAK